MVGSINNGGWSPLKKGSNRVTSHNGFGGYEGVYIRMDRSVGQYYPQLRSKNMPAKVRFWVFTDNVVGAAQPRWKELPSGVRYIIYQVEKVEHEHLQGYVELISGQRLSWVKKNISSTAHWEIRHGTQQEAIAYCKKDESRVSGPYELGVPSKGRGSRTDVIAFRDAIKSGKRRRDLFEEQPLMMARYYKFYDHYKRTIVPERSEDERFKVMLFYGSTGTGKTRKVYKEWGKSNNFRRLPCNNGTMWFDGYDMHKYVLLDDFAGAASHISLVMLLQILDRYPIEVPVKGSFTWWLPIKIVVTTNLHPRNWYKWENRESQYLALKRRFTAVFDFDTLNERGKPKSVGKDFWEQW